MSRLPGLTETESLVARGWEAGRMQGLLDALEAVRRDLDADELRVLRAEDDEAHAGNYGYGGMGVESAALSGLEFAERRIERRSAQLLREAIR